MPARGCEVMEGFIQQTAGQVGHSPQPWSHLQGNGGTSIRRVDARLRTQQATVQLGSL